MMKHSVKDNLIHLSIDKMDFSYRIPIQKLGTTIDCKIGTKGSKGIGFKQISAWAFQLFTKNVTEIKFVKQFEKIVQEHAPNNSINWEETILAVKIQNQYNWLIETNKTAKNKQSEEELISGLKKKYKLD